MQTFVKEQSGSQTGTLPAKLADASTITEARWVSPWQSHQQSCSCQFQGIHASLVLPFRGRIYSDLSHHPSSVSLGGVEAVSKPGVYSNYYWY